MVSGLRIDFLLKIADLYLQPVNSSRSIVSLANLMLQLFVFLLELIEKWQICLNCVPEEIKISLKLENFARLRPNLLPESSIFDRNI